MNEQEAAFFADRVRQHAPLEPTWPFTDILGRIERIFADSVCTTEEREELKEIMEALCGRSPVEPTTETLSTKLPFNSPPPVNIDFTNRHFNITGKFAFGSRQKVVDSIAQKGGIAKDAMPSHDSNYLVIGVFASRDWVHTNFGRKIERAIELRDSDSGLIIISEEHWKRFLE